MRVTFYTLGCKVNQNETGALAQLFEESGYTVVSNDEGADVYVVNSCTVTNFGDQKSRKWLRRAKRENPGAVTVLTGCYPQAFPDEAAAIDDHVIDGLVGRHIADLVSELVQGRLVDREIECLQIGAEHILRIRCHQAVDLVEEVVAVGKLDLLPVV